MMSRGRGSGYPPKIMTSLMNSPYKSAHENEIKEIRALGAS